MNKLAIGISCISILASSMAFGLVETTFPVVILLILRRGGGGVYRAPEAFLGATTRNNRHFKIGVLDRDCYVVRPTATTGLGAYIGPFQIGFGKAAPTTWYCYDYVTR